MTFPLIQPQTSQMTLDRVNWLMSNYNASLATSVADFKKQWLQFWDDGLSVTDMQAQLDLLASSPASEQGQPTNALEVYFASALDSLSYLSRRSPTALNDAVLETTGAAQPNGKPYQRFLTPGWYYTVDESKPSGMSVSAPCVFPILQGTY